MLTVIVREPFYLFHLHSVFHAHKKLTVAERTEERESRYKLDQVNSQIYLFYKLHNNSNNNDS